MSVLITPTIEWLGNRLLNFDGNDYAQSASVPVLSTCLTVEAWVYPTLVGSASYPEILQSSRATCENGFVLRAHEAGDSKPQFFVRAACGATAAWKSATAASPLAANTWTHLVGTWSNASPDVKLYVDGVLSACENYAGYSLKAPSAVTMFGVADFAGTKSSYFRGRMRDVAVFSEVRTAASIVSDMNGLIGTEPGLLRWWKLMDGPGTSACDSSAVHGDTATLYGPTWIVGAGPSSLPSMWTDISSDVVRAEGVQANYGITGIGPLDLMASTGNLSFALDNSETNSGKDHADGVEKVLNGGFETAGGGGADIWANWAEDAGDGAIADEGALVHGGSHAAKFTAGASFTAYILQAPVTVPGTTYQLSFWTRGDATNAGRYQVYDNSNGANIIATTTTGVPGTTYTQVSVVFTAPAGCIDVWLILRCPAVNGAIAYFDDVSVQRLLPGVGYYTPGHANARSGWDLGSKVRLSFAYSGSTFYKMVGYATSIAPTAGLYKERRADVQAVDWLDFAGTQKVRQLDIQSNITTGCALQLLLAEAVMQPRATCIGTSQETYDRVFDSDNDAKTTIAAGIAKLVRNELGQVFLRGDTAGGETLEVQGRYGRVAGGQTATASLNSTMVELEIEYSRDNIWNVVRGRTYPKAIDTSACTCVFTLQSPIQVGASQTKTFTAHYRDAYSAKAISASAIVYPFRASVDYNFGSASGTGGDDKNSSACFSASIGSNSAQIAVENNSAALAYLNDFKLYGKGIYYFDPVEYEARDATSASSYGERVLDLELEYQTSEARGEPLAQYLLGIWKNPRRLVKSVRFLANKSAALAEAAMRCEPGSRVYISESMTATGGYYDINSVQYETTSAQETWVTWGVAAADTTEYFRLDHSLLDVDVLAP